MIFWGATVPPWDVVLRKVVKIVFGDVSTHLAERLIARVTIGKREPVHRPRLPASSTRL
ncbi:hypothetical protein ACFQJ8_21730 [Halocatena marina]|uniref:hypothetical protein n=1 Tax=Halocatena marina TaxID=2934937 RepID=UPI00361A492F